MLSGTINKLGWRRCKASVKVSIAPAREPGRSYSSTYRFARGLTSRIFGGAFVLGSECGNVELVLYLWEQLLRGDEMLLLTRFIGANIKSRQWYCSVKVPRENAHGGLSCSQRLYNFRNAKAIIIYTLMTLPIKRHS